MNLSGLLGLLQQVDAYKQVRRSLVDGTGNVSRRPLGLMVAARPYVVAALARDLAQPVLLLTARSDQARLWVEQLQVWLPEEEQVYHLADPDALPYERINWSRETRQARLRALGALAKAEDTGPRVVVASARALAQKTLPPRELRISLRRIRRGQALNLTALLQQWLGLGYVHMPVVDEPGTFSRRGGIVDIWSPTLPYPVRMEFFGDEVESIRYFNPSSQRTEQQLDDFVIAPASEALCKLGPQSAERLAGLDIRTCHPIAREDYERELEQLAAGTSFRGMEFYLPYLYSQPASPLDYLPDNGILLVEDGADLGATLDDLTGQAHQLQEELRGTGELPAGALRPFWTWDELQATLLARKPCILGYTDLDKQPVETTSALAGAFSVGTHYGGQMRPMVESVETRRRSGERLVLVSRQASRLCELLTDAGRPTSVEYELRDTPPAASLSVMQGLLPDGWTLHPFGMAEAAEDAPGSQAADQPVLLALLTDAEIFGWVKPQPRRPVRHRAVSPESFFNDVQPGDFVVHYEHGIGQFQGLVRLTVDNMEREYLQVDYAQGDRLYVPVHQADRLSRYIGSSDAPPPMNRLGTADWGLVKARTQRAVADIAEELLQLYARREALTGYAFSPDTAWQQEMEASFPYVETEDQLAAIAMVKRDMERAQPMDRLVCGDVGYGKTEVALRAAFKAVNDGKQVAVLVPTTVLAQQHWQTFSQRLGAFPVRIEMLSRFRSRAEQRKVLEELEDGKVDIVIGTHRLLQDDVGFKDLGLLIIDEEQRFGVTHKERLKQLRNEVDVLTLTATPIPRTLYMSLSGVRDLSTIDTPPEERLPVRTTLAEYDDGLIRQAILREFDRDGQVFFVHDRVMGIENLAERIRKLVPEVRVGVAHGQMPEHDLEEMMVRFADGQIDVLVCTTIIESGLDIPNANTIIINRADHFGLAQLYQLRGRVGRSALRAYCYLLYDKATSLTPLARRRLESIMEASELGAGFRIAMDDLEMRGAGDLLGARQHGHIAAVGFDLYCRLLAQAVKEVRTHPEKNGRNGARKEEEPVSPFDPLQPGVTLELPLAMSIPETYVDEASLRLLLYRRMAGLHTLESVDEMAKELSDRFGPPPVDVQNLLYSLRIRVLAVQAGVVSISREEGQLVLKSEALENLNRQQLQQRLGERARVSRRQVWMSLDNDPEWMAHLEQVLTVWSRVAEH